MAQANTAESRLRALVEATAAEVAEPGVCGCPMPRKKFSIFCRFRRSFAVKQILFIRLR